MRRALLLALLCCSGAHAQKYERRVIAGSGALHHGGSLLAMIRTGDGTLGTAGGGFLRLWSTVDGAPRGGARLVGTHPAGVRGLTRDGKQLLIWADRGRRFKLWDIAARKAGVALFRVAKEESSAEVGFGFADSADRVLCVGVYTRILTASGRGARDIFHSADVRIRDTAGTLIATLKPEGEILPFAAMSSDGAKAYLVLGDGVTVETWDVASARRVASVKVPGMRRVRDGAAFADGKRLLDGGECKWDFLDLTGRKGMFGAGSSKEAQLARDAAPLCVVDAAGKRLWKGGDIERAVVGVVLDERNGRAIAGNSYGELALYDTDGKRLDRPVKRVHVSALSFAGPELIGGGKSIHRWSARGELLERLTLEQAELRPVKALVGAAGRVLARTYKSDAPDVMLYGLAEDADVRTLWQRGGSHYCQSIALGPGKSFGLIRHGPTRDKCAIERWHDPARREGLVPIASDRGISRAVLAPGLAHAAIVAREPVGPDKKKVRAHIGIVDAKTGKLLRWIADPSATLLVRGSHYALAWTRASFDATGRRLAIASAWAERVWVFDVNSGALLLEVQTSRAHVAFAGSRLVVGARGAIELWDVVGKQRLARLSNRATASQIPVPISALAVTADAARIAVAGTDGSVAIYSRKE